MSPEQQPVPGADEQEHDVQHLPPDDTEGGDI